jgi:hypothetical protein
VSLIRCVGCGTPLGQTPYTQAHVEHARTCPKHPLAAEIAELKREVEHLLAGHGERAVCEHRIEAGGDGGCADCYGYVVRELTRLKEAGHG